MFLPVSELYGQGIILYVLLCVPGSFHSVCCLWHSSILLQSLEASHAHGWRIFHGVKTQQCTFPILLLLGVWSVSSFHGALCICKILDLHFISFHPSFTPRAGPVCSLILKIQRLKVRDNGASGVALPVCNAWGRVCLLSWLSGFLVRVWLGIPPWLHTAWLHLYEISTKRKTMEHKWEPGLSGAGSNDWL